MIETIETIPDDIQINCFFLGCILGLVINYPKLIHGCDSRDVVRSKFVKNGTCYRFKPRPVVCGWHQRFVGVTSQAVSSQPSNAPPLALRDPG